MPIDGFSKVAGENHLYYFAYNSFGNNSEITDELYNFIGQIKRETGHDKINVVAISLGGTIANSLFDRYRSSIRASTAWCISSPRSTDRI